MLREYLGKNVKIITINKKERKGFIDAYTPAIDNDENEDSIVIDIGSEYIELFENEIISIEIIETTK